MLKIKDLITLLSTRLDYQLKAPAELKILEANSSDLGGRGLRAGTSKRGQKVAY